MGMPTYQLVQKSLQDIVQAQKLTINQLQEEISGYGDMVSKAEFDSVAQELEVLRKQLKLLQSDNHDLRNELKVNKEALSHEKEDKKQVQAQLETVRNSVLELEQQVRQLRYELQEEQLARGLEQQDLMDQADKLQLAFSEVASLSEAASKDKTQHDKTSGVLKSKLKKELSKKREVEKKLREVQDMLEETEQQSKKYEGEIKALKQQVAQLKRQRQAHAEEAELQLQQTHYLSRLMSSNTANSSAASLNSSLKSTR